MTDCAVWSRVLSAGELPAPVFNPGSISGLVGWWDAAALGTVHLSGSEVTQWDDKSGLGNNMSRPGGATGPSSGTRTKNGLNVLDFVSAQRLTPGLATSLGYTAFVVCVQDTTPGSPFVSTLLHWGTANERGIRIGSGTSDVVETAGGIRSTAGAFVANGTWRQITGEEATAGGGVLRVRDNGAAGSATTTLGGPNAFDNLTIGAQPGGVRPLDGAIAEIILYYPMISTTDRDLVEAYLIAKWAIP